MNQKRKISIYALIFILLFYNVHAELHIFGESDLDSRPLDTFAFSDSMIKKHPTLKSSFKLMGNHFHAHPISTFLLSGVILLLTIQGILVIRKALGKQLDEKAFNESNTETTELREEKQVLNFVPRNGDDPDFVKGKDTNIVK